MELTISFLWDDPKTWQLTNIQLGWRIKKNIKRIKKNILGGDQKENIKSIKKKYCTYKIVANLGKELKTSAPWGIKKKILLEIHVEGRRSRNSLHSALNFSPDSFSCRGSFLRLFVSSSSCFLISSISSVPRVLLRTGSIYNVSIHIMNVFSLYEK